MALIRIQHLNFTYEGSYEPVFQDVSLQLDTDWKLGLIGRNGRGKTTLLRLLMDEMEYQGSIEMPVQCSYFPFAVKEEEKGALEVAQAVCPEIQDWEIIRELNRMEIKEEILERPFYTLSNGEKTKVLLATLFLQENHFLLIDEPTNHLDQQGRKSVARYLKGKKGFILVSHDRTFLDGCVDHIVSINRKDIEVQKGNFSSWYENKRRQDDLERKENEKLRREAGRLKEAAARTAGWSDRIEKTKYGGEVADRGFVGHRSAKMMKRSKAIEARRQTALEEKEKLLRNIEVVQPLKLTPLAYHSKTLAFLREAAVYYGEQPACKNVTFNVEQGERVALQGANGTGKSSLIKWLAGEPVAIQGEAQKGSGLIVSFVPQDASFLNGKPADYARTCGVDISQFFTILRKLDVPRTQFEKEMGTFSLGQKKKVLLARSLCQQAHLYLWDEPLNYIDLFSRMQLEELLKESGLTMVFVEHDQAFVERVATKTIQL